MIVVVNLIKSVFLSFFISMLFIEVVFLITAIFCYRSALDTNMDKIIQDTEIYKEEISENFISQINTHYSNVQSDLLMVAKHGYPMYLTQNNIQNKEYFYFNKNSTMYEELKKLNPFEEKKENNKNKNLMKELVNQVYKNDTKFDESQFMESLLLKEELNKVYTLKKSKEDINENMKVYLNYLIPIMKSILIRNAIYEKDKNIYLRFIIYLDDNNFKFEYPNNQQETANFPIKEKLEEDKVIFDGLNFDNISKQLMSRGCLKLDFEKLSYVCLEFTFDNFLENLRNPSHKYNKNSNDYIGMFLIDKAENNNLEMWFSSMKNESFTEKKKLMDELLEEVNRSMEDKIKENLEKNITSYINQFNENITKNNDNKEKNELEKKLELKLEMKTNLIDLIDTHANNINVTILPIYSEEKFIDRTNFVFKNDETIVKKPMGYFMISSLFGPSDIRNIININLLFKSFRITFLFVFIILLFTVFFYILTELFMKLLLSSLKILKEELKKIIKAKKINYNQVKDLENLIKKNNDFDQIACNKEMKDLFNSLEFLNKILYLKSNEHNVDDDEKRKIISDIYKKFETQLNNTKTKNNKAFRNFKLKSIYNSYKQNYLDAYHNLDLYFKSINEDITKNLLDNNFREIKTDNLKKHNYINDYVDFNSDNSEGKETIKITTKISLNMGYFYYGYIKLKQAEEKIKAQKKSNKEKDKEIYKTLINEAIKYFNESIKICRSENMNRIKVIMMMIYLARCYYLRQEYNEAAIKIKDAMIEFGNFNISFFDPNCPESKMTPKLDPRVMIFINSNFLEQIFYHLSKINYKLNKKKLSGLVLNTIIDNCYYFNRKIMIKVFKNLRKIIFPEDIAEKELVEIKEIKNFINLEENEVLFHKKSNYLLNKIIYRIDPSANKEKKQGQEATFEKNLWMVITESLLVKFPCPIDLKSFLVRCLKYYLKDTDVVNFAQINESYTEYLPNIDKKNLNLFTTRPDLFNINTENIDYENNSVKKDGDFSTSIKKIVSFIDEDEKQKGKNIDKIVFLFINSSNFRLNDADDPLFDVLRKNKISVYCFCFDELSEKKMIKMKTFLKFLYEGHLIIVKNYEVIERAFQNISYPSDNLKNKNVLTLKFSNHNFIH